MSAARFGLKVGWKVAVALKAPVANLACYVGEIQHVDAHGLRLTLIDWFSGSFSGFDFAVPWDNVLGIHVCTDQHDIQVWEADKFQTRHQDMLKAGTVIANDGAEPVSQQERA